MVDPRMFSKDGNHFAAVSSDSTIKVWDTNSGSLVGEWIDSDKQSDSVYTCISCNIVGKKRKKEDRILLVVLGTSAGDVVAVDVLNGGRKWSNNQCHSGATSKVMFVDKWRKIFTVGVDGVVCQLDSETGECLEKFKASKKAIRSLTSSNDEKLLAISSDKVRVFTLPDKREILKFSSDLGRCEHIALLDDGSYAVSSVLAESQLQLWSFDLDSRSATANTVLSMQGSPLMLECRNYDEDGIVVLSVSDRGIAYVWHWMDNLEVEVKPTRISVKTSKSKLGQEKSNKKKRLPILAAKLCNSVSNKQIFVHIACGSLISLKFKKVEVTDFGEDICLAIDDYSLDRMDYSSHQELGVNVEDAICEKDGDIDMNEPTMAEKLASLDMPSNAKSNGTTDADVPINPVVPSADSVHVLLKQALNADDHALLLDCLYTRDEEVVSKSTSLLNPADVLKFLRALISMVQSRGAVLACAIPWLKCVLSQHTSSIVSQESSFRILNSLFQLIDSRVSTYASALELSTSLDYLFARLPDDDADEESMLPAIVYEDRDTDEDESDDAMETDEKEDSEGMEEIINSQHDSDASEVMSD